MELKKNQNERRNFLMVLGKSAIALSLLSYFPFKLFVPEKQKQISVKIHPGAVKRKGK